MHQRVELTNQHDRIVSAIDTIVPELKTLIQTVFPFQYTCTFYDCLCWMFSQIEKEKESNALSIDLTEYGKKLHQIADYCTKNGRNDKVADFVRIPSLDTLQTTLNVIETESTEQKIKQESQNFFITH